MTTSAALAKLPKIRNELASTQKSLAEAQRVNHLLSSELDSLKTYIKYLKKYQEDCVSAEIARLQKFKQSKLDKE